MFSQFKTISEKLGAAVYNTIYLDVLARNIMVLLSAQVAIIISLEPAFSLLGVETSLPKSATSKMQVLCLSLHRKLVRKSQCYPRAKRETNMVKKVEMGI